MTEGDPVPEAPLSWWHVLRAGWHQATFADPTQQFQLALACGLILRARWMLAGSWNSMPLETQGYLLPHQITEEHWGTLLLVIGVLQTIVALRRGPLGRGVMATIASVVQGDGLWAYYASHQEYRGVVPLLILLVGGEMFVAWRVWHDLWVARQLPERREHGHGHA